MQRLGYGMNDPRFEFGQGQEIFVFSETSGQALGPTLFPVEWEGGGIMSSVF